MVLWSRKVAPASPAAAVVPSQAAAGAEAPADNLARKRLGQSGEDAAVRFLRQRGYRMVARNWRPSGGGSRGGRNRGAMRGEIDCIAWHGQVLCFIEVKTRASLAFGAPQEAVGPTKQRQLCRLANAYISIQRLHDTACRFDVVEVLLSDPEARPRLALHQNAFDYKEAG